LTKPGTESAPTKCQEYQYLGMASLPSIVVNAPPVLQYGSNKIIGAIIS
jgi:hypothetical protein